MKLADMHSHTTLCKHAVGRPEEYLESAQKAGLAYFGISDHFPYPSNYDVDFRMFQNQFSQYREIVRSMQKKAEGSGVQVLYGTEFDYLPGQMDEGMRLLNSEPFDYLLGSIHELDGFGYDDPGNRDKWETIGGVDKLFNRYADLLLEFISKHDFQILAHPDLPKKFIFWPEDEKKFYGKMRLVFEAAGKKGMALEINTAGLRKDVREIYPKPELVKMAREFVMFVAFGADSHHPSEVAYAFPQAVELAKSAGYKAAVAFVARQPVELPFD